MPSLKSCDPPPSDEETSAPRPALRLLQFLLPSPPPSAISLRPSLPSTTAWRKKAQKLCQNHRALSLHHSLHHWSPPLTPRRSGMWLAQRFEGQAPQRSPKSRLLDLLFWCGSAAASVLEQTRRSAHTQSQRTWMRSGFLMTRLLTSSGVEEVNKKQGLTPLYRLSQYLPRDLQIIKSIFLWLRSKWLGSYSTC